MSKNVIRKDKTCLNCNHVVAERFCPNCGQENSDTRKTFHHLFIHFFEDLTHYENAFWKTIKNLLFKPAALTKEYLSGKRLSYLAPVRLYIFISFVTFFTISVFPDAEEKEDNKTESNKYFSYNELKDSIEQKNINTLTPQEKKVNELLEKGLLSKKDADSIKLYIKEGKKKESQKGSFMNFGYGSVKELDSIRKAKPNEMDDLEYWLNKKSIEINENNTQGEIKEKFIEGLKHNFPKALFIYMPLFAFVLWLFHNKKRRYYFDHGIFTLHYFSFLLLIVLFNFLINKIFSSLETVGTIIKFITTLWMLYYFFPAHHRFYEESRVVSLFKSIAMLVINIFLITLISLLFVLYTFLTIH